VISQLLRVATTQACPSVSNQILSVIVIPVIRVSILAKELPLAEIGDDLMLYGYTYLSLTVGHELPAADSSATVQDLVISSHFSATCSKFY